MFYWSITGFVACGCDCKWWDGCGLSTEEESGTVKIIFLHPNGLSLLYSYTYSL